MNIRLKRFILAFLLPPILGSLLLIMYSVFDNWNDSDLMSFKALYEVIVLFFLTIIPVTLSAFLLSGLQSFVYAFLMEWVVQPRIKNSVLFILTSCSLGTLSGLTLTLLIGVVEFTVFGLIIGICVGWLLAKMSIQNA